MLKGYYWGALIGCLMFAVGCKHKDSIRIYVVGDLLLDRGVRKQIQKHGADYLFDGVRSEFKNADAVIANLECPVTDISHPVYKRFVFRGEPEWLHSVKNAGITHMVMSNNHTYDQGNTGITDTYQNIIANNLVAVGYGANQQASCEPVIIKGSEFNVAVFSSIWLALENRAWLPNEVSVCQANAERLAETIRAYKSANPNDKVLVVLHWGVEYSTKPLPSQRMQAHQLIDAGADALVGHHPHVVQDVVNYRGKPIFYSVGNFVFDQKSPGNIGSAAILEFYKDTVSYSSKEILIKNCKPEFTGNNRY